MFLCLCETFLHEGILDSEIKISGFSIIRCDRMSRAGGGVCVYVSNSTTYLLILFKQSLSSGVIDPSLKRDVIVPVFKSGNRTAHSNSNPIYLTSVIIKVLEIIIICKQIVAFLISKGYLNPTQHGFREGHSCLSALSLMTSCTK